MGCRNLNNMFLLSQNNISAQGSDIFRKKKYLKLHMMLHDSRNNHVSSVSLNARQKMGRMNINNMFTLPQNIGVPTAVRSWRTERSSKDMSMNTDDF